MSEYGTGCIRILAFGKINLYLDVLGKRPDGFHEVAMIMQSVRLADVIDIREANKNAVRSSSRYVPDNPQNLAWRAAELMQGAYDLPKVAIRIEKNIPVSAGMAGGSADAAGVILGMDRLFGLHRPTQELMRLAEGLGSDVPFCLAGPTALALGRGEKLLPVQTLPKWHIVLVKPNFGVSTARVYGHYAKQGTTAKKAGMPRLEKYLEALASGDATFLYQHLFNALEPTTFSLYPKVKEIKETIRSVHNGHILMSGSGPTIFSAFEDPIAAWKVYRTLRRQYSGTFLTSTVDDATLRVRVSYPENTE